MKGSLQNMLGLIFSGLCIILAVAVWIWPMPEGIVGQRNPQSARAVAEVVPLDLDAIATRPLFDRTRRPLKIAPAPVAEAPKPAAVTLSLNGVIGNSDGGLTALLRLSNSDELFARRAGETIENFTVQRIESKQVTLRDGAGKLYVLILGNE